MLQSVQMRYKNLTMFEWRISFKDFSKYTHNRNNSYDYCTKTNRATKAKYAHQDHGRGYITINAWLQFWMSFVACTRIFSNSLDATTNIQLCYFFFLFCSESHWLKRSPIRAPEMLNWTKVTKSNRFTTISTQWRKWCHSWSTITDFIYIYIELDTQTQMICNIIAISTDNQANQSIDGKHSAQSDSELTVKLYIYIHNYIYFLYSIVMRNFSSICVMESHRFVFFSFRYCSIPLCDCEFDFIQWAKGTHNIDVIFRCGHLREIPCSW